MSRRYTIEYDNDTGPNDEGFSEWWMVFDRGEPLCTCSTEEDAKRIVAALELAEQQK